MGAQKPAPHRVTLNPATYGTQNLEFLLAGDWLPPDYRSRYESVVRRIVERITPWFESTKIHRLHGDCHLGNLLWGTEGPFFLDFDDMVNGPAIQDLWLLLPNRSREQIEDLLEGYEEIRAFDRSTFRLIEPLRALRFVHYTAWVAKRWADPAFPQAFPQFGSHRYWKDETEDLEKQWELIAENDPSRSWQPS